MVGLFFYLTNIIFQRLASFCDEVCVAYGSTEIIVLASIVGKQNVLSNLQYTGNIEKGVEIRYHSYVTSTISVSVSN